MATEYPGYSSILDDRPFCYFKPSFVGDMPIFVGSRLHPQDQAAGVGVGSQGPALLWQAAAWLASWQSALGFGNLGFSEFLGAKKMD